MSPLNSLKALGLGAIDGLTLDLAPHILDAIDGDDDNLKRWYIKNRDELQQSNPYAYWGGNIGSGFIPGVGVVSVAGKGLKGAKLANKAIGGANKAINKVRKARHTNKVNKKQTEINNLRNNLKSMRTDNPKLRKGIEKRASTQNAMDQIETIHMRGFNEGSDIVRETANRDINTLLDVLEKENKVISSIVKKPASKVSKAKAELKAIKANPYKDINIPKIPIKGGTEASTKLGSLAKGALSGAGTAGLSDYALQTQYTPAQDVDGEQLLSSILTGGALGGAVGGYLGKTTDNKARDFLRDRYKTKLSGGDEFVEGKLTDNLLDDIVELDKEHKLLGRGNFKNDHQRVEDLLEKDITSQVDGLRNAQLAKEDPIILNNPKLSPDKLHYSDDPNKYYTHSGENIFRTPSPTTTYTGYNSGLIYSIDKAPALKSNIGSQINKLSGAKEIRKGEKLGRLEALDHYPTKLRDEKSHLDNRLKYFGIYPNEAFPTSGYPRTSYSARKNINTEHKYDPTNHTPHALSILNRDIQLGSSPKEGSAKGIGENIGRLLGGIRKREAGYGAVGGLAAGLSGGGAIGGATGLLGGVYAPRIAGAVGRKINDLSLPTLRDNPDVLKIASNPNILSSGAGNIGSNLNEDRQNNQFKTQILNNLEEKGLFDEFTQVSSQPNFIKTPEYKAVRDKILDELIRLGIYKNNELIEQYRDIVHRMLSLNGNEGNFTRQQ